MSFFNDFHVLPGTHTSSYTSSVSNDIFGGFHSFVLNLIAGIKFKMKLWKPPKMSLETLEVYDDVWVPGKKCKSVKKLMNNSSFVVNN